MVLEGAPSEGICAWRHQASFEQLRTGNHKDNHSVLDSVSLEESGHAGLQSRFEQLLKRSHKGNDTVVEGFSIGGSLCPEFSQPAVSTCARKT